jgi:hypothetical protein
VNFPPEHYFQSAILRVTQARYRYEEGANFALAIYFGGVGVECMLRAFKEITGYKKIKGDYLKEQARRFLNSAQSFINKGVVLWHV